MNSDQTWNLTPLYKGDTDPQIKSDLEKASLEHRSFAKRWQSNDGYLSDPIVLKQAISDYERLGANHGLTAKAGYYFSLRSSQDLGDPTIRARLGQVEDIGKENSDIIRFFILKLGQVSQEQQALFLSNNELIKYHELLRRIFEHAKYRLSDAEERVFSLLAEPAHNRWSEMMAGFLAKAERVALSEEGTQGLRSFSDLSSLISSRNKKVRDCAAKALSDILIANLDVAENELNAILETEKINGQLRGYDRPDRERHVHDNINPAVVDTLIRVVAANCDIAHRFYLLKAKLLGQKKLEYHERSVEYGESVRNYSFGDAVKLVDKAMTRLDPQFSVIFSQFVKNGQIDVYPRLGKRGGAFCAFDRSDLPVYILLNHTNKLRDVTTLAHELGHGINDELVRSAQPPVYVGTPLSTAEVASTFMEDFALDEIGLGASDEERLSILMMKLNDDISTIFRQVAAYKFEQELHDTYRRSGYLSKEIIGLMFQKHMKGYMGEAIEQSAGSENWWVGWHHFRRPFYVYSYASGLLISKSLQSSVRADSTFIEKVKTFLSTGLSESPVSIFKKLDIDITDDSFWQAGINQVKNSLEEAEKLAVKCAKL